MRRVILALLATTVGLVLLLSYKAHTPSTATSALAAPDPGPSATTDPTSGAIAGPDPVPSASASASASAGSTSGSNSGTSTSTSTAKSGTFVGDPVSSQFSTIQVEVVLSSGRISDIKLLEDVDDERRSAQIDGYATPILRSEALSAQSANIDVVSGATFTSQSYSQSLQSALDKAGV